jgi:uncharacterized protein YbjT (DUF2867 family)
VAWTILRPGVFASNFLIWLDRAQDGIFVPAGEGDRRLRRPHDVAACAVQFLTTSGHDGLIYEISGSERLSFAEAAEAISAAVGRTIIYRDVPEEVWRQAMLSHGAPAPDVEFILRYFAGVNAGKMYPPTRTIADILRRPPRTFAEWARNNARALRGTRT